MKTDLLSSSSSHSDPRLIMFKYQTLMQDYHELRKETEFKMMKLEMMKQKRSTLEAEVRFLRRRYKHLKKKDQSLETNPKKMLRLSESKDLQGTSKQSGERKKPSSGLRASVPCSVLKQKDTICNQKEALANNNASSHLVKKPKRCIGNDVVTNPIQLPGLSGDGNTFVSNKVSGFDLNRISGEEEEPESKHMVAEATTKNGMVGDRRGELKLPICRDVEKELSRAVKRKVTWQDPVALSV
ncbi:unnamed protein product [Cochlearia groenlandica]